VSGTWPRGTPHRLGATRVFLTTAYDSELPDGRRGVQWPHGRAWVTVYHVHYLGATQVLCDGCQGCDAGHHVLPRSQLATGHVALLDVLRHVEARALWNPVVVLARQNTASQGRVAGVATARNAQVGHGSREYLCKGTALPQCSGLDVVVGLLLPPPPLTHTQWSQTGGKHPSHPPL
jgi:hypothetical protein